MGGYTNFPNGITSLGIPTFGAGPLITQGNIFFVKPSSGLDGNSGKTPDRALKTLARAHALMTADQNDICFLMAESNSAASTTDYQSETLTWSKDLCHLIGVGGGGGPFGSRSRIACDTVSVSPLVNVTADACFFANIHVYHGVTADQAGYIAFQVTGDRNVFKNCHFAGGGVSTVADDAAMRSLKLAGAAENYFEDCIIGLDTLTRGTTANYELEFDGNSTVDGCARTMFKNCKIITMGSGAHGLVQVDADGIDRYVIFEDCLFLNPIQSTVTALNECFSCAASTSPAGAIVLKNCLRYGVGPWEADTETARVVGAGFLSQGQDLTSTALDDFGAAGAPESP